MDDLKVGMTVSTADGAVLGEVKEVVGDRFKVDVHLHPDYWLEKTTVASVTGRQVKLHVTKGELVNVQEGLPRPTMSGNLNA